MTSFKTRGSPGSVSLT